MVRYTTPNAIRTRLGGCEAWTDPKLNPLIERASNFIEFATGWWFEARSMMFSLDGRFTETLLVPVPIITVTKIEILDWPGVPSGTSEVSLDSVAIYNRHITEHLSNPDDRLNPKISFLGVESGRRIIAADVWPRGRRNVRLTGVFGYTDADPDAGRTIPTNALDQITAADQIHMEDAAFTQEDVGRTITIVGSASNDGSYVISTVVNSKDITTDEQTLTTEGAGFTADVSAFPQWGVLPFGIKEVCELLVIRDLPVIPGSGGIGGPQDGAWYERMMRAQGRLTQEKVRDQSMSFAAPGSTDGNTMGVITGDPMIDMYLLQFKRPTIMRSA